MFPTNQEIKERNCDLCLADPTSRSTETGRGWVASAEKLKDPIVGSYEIFWGLDILILYSGITPARLDGLLSLFRYPHL